MLLKEFILVITRWGTTSLPSQGLFVCPYNNNFICWNGYNCIRKALQKHTHTQTGIEKPLHDRPPAIHLDFCIYI